MPDTKGKTVKFKFNLGKLTSIIGYVIATGAITEILPAQYRPLSAVVGAVILGFLHSPIEPPDALVLKTIAEGSALLGAADQSLPAKYAAELKPLLKDVDVVSSTLLQDAGTPPGVSSATPIQSPPTV